MNGRFGRRMLGAVAALALAGCAPVLIGAGVAGGYAIGKDSIRNTFEYPRSHVLGVSRDVLNSQGLITLEDQAHGTLKAEVQGTKVTVTVRPVSGTSVELTVQARNQFMMPSIDVAQAIYNQIREKL